MKKLILIVMLALCTVTITSRPVQTYAYTEEQKQQAKAWLSAHGYPPTRAGAEQAYQDYMDGKIDVPEADAYLGRDKQKKVEEKKNSTSTTNKANQKTESERTAKTKNTESTNTESQTSDTSKTTTTATEKTVTTETKEQQKQKEEKKKQPQKLLLTWMVNEPQLFEKLKGIIGPDDFYEQIYHGVALLLFKQYEEENAVIPGKILNQYTDLNDQKKIAELFNTTLKISPSPEDRNKALNDIVRRVKEDSIEQQMNATNDILKWQDLIKEKANLAKLHISL